MKTKKLITNIAFALTLGIVYTGCNKKDDVLDTDTSSSSDNSTSDNVFSSMFKSVGEVSDTASGLKSSCPIITVDTTVGVTPWPKTITIDYGTTGCNDKKGVITAVLTGRFRDSSSVATITTNNFYHTVNGISYKVEAGTHTITNKGHVNGHQNFSVVVSGASLTSASGVISWNTTRTIEWLEGELTPLNTADDVYLISGTASGVSIKGVSFNSSITTPLKIATACQWIESGVISLTPSGKTARVVDFGNSGCDNKATVTISGKSFDVTM